MLWTRRWGIIGFVALAQLGIVVSYQAFLSGGEPPVNAQTVFVRNAQAVDAPGNRPNSRGSAVQVGPGPIALEEAAVTPKIPVPALPPEGIPAPPSLPRDFVDGPPIVRFPAGPLVSQAPTFDPEVLPAGLQQSPGNGQLGLPGMSQEVPNKASNMPGEIVLPSAPTRVDLPNPPGKLPSQKVVQQVQPIPACPWNLNVEIIDGRTHLTATNGKEVKFTVSCEKLGVQTPDGFIYAVGKVILASTNIEGSCDRLTISWKDDVVVLEKAQLKCNLPGHEASMQAEQLRVRLSPAAVTEASSAAQTGEPPFPADALPPPKMSGVPY